VQGELLYYPNCNAGADMQSGCHFQFLSIVTVYFTVMLNVSYIFKYTKQFKLIILLLFNVLVS
jgi:hypothetical protein